LIKLKEEINGIIEELLQEDESDFTDINILLYDAVTIVTQTMNQTNIRGKNRRNENF
jgi:hypothetical protein